MDQLYESPRRDPSGADAEVVSTPPERTEDEGFGDAFFEGQHDHGPEAEEHGFFDRLGERLANLATFGEFETDEQIGSRLAAMEAAFLAGGTEGLAEHIREEGALTGTTAILEAGAGGVGFVLRSGGPTLAEAAGGRALANGDIVVAGGRERAKALFKFFDEAGVGNRQIAADTTGRGRAVVGQLADGTPLRIRFLPDGRTRIQAGKQKFRFGEE